MSGERSRRDFLKISGLGLAASATADAWNSPRSEPQESPKSEIIMWTTAGEDRFRRMPSATWTAASPRADVQAITVDPTVQFQKILGFGAAFTDASCYLFSRLSSTQRARLFRELFHPSEM